MQWPPVTIHYPDRSSTTVTHEEFHAHWELICECGTPGCMNPVGDRAMGPDGRVGYLEGDSW